MPFEDILVHLAGCIDKNTIPVAHHLQYDYNDVLLCMCDEMEKNGTFTVQRENALCILKKCKKMCTCLNLYTKTATEICLRKKTPAYYHQKIEKMDKSSAQTIGAYK